MCVSLVFGVVSTGLSVCSVATIALSEEGGVGLLGTRVAAAAAIPSSAVGAVSDGLVSLVCISLCNCVG